MKTEAALPVEAPRLTALAAIKALPDPKSWSKPAPAKKSTKKAAAKPAAKKSKSKK